MRQPRRIFGLAVAVALLAVNGWTLTHLWRANPLWAVSGAVFLVLLAGALFHWANVTRKKRARALFMARVSAVVLGYVSPAEVVRKRGVGYWL